MIGKRKTTQPQPVSKPKEPSPPEKKEKTQSSEASVKKREVK